MERSRKLTVWILFGVYVLALLLLLFRRHPAASYSYGLRPFETIRGYFLLLRRHDPWESALRQYALVNFFGNILAFLPLGLFLPLLFRQQRRFWLFLLTVTATIVAVELLQLVTRTGALDVDDLILNLPGACLGWLTWRLWPRGTKKNGKCGPA